MKFPILKSNQVAVIKADGATGTILNLKGEIYKNGSPENPYIIFESLLLAHEYVGNESRLNDKLEFVIYDNNQNVLDFIKSIHWNK
ncbi:hypothetical protein [Flavobacterium eburneipallidum]|uniref:hypothetical protein n=1 Tax=Flavobacterium eburneipallidum TaxID=3003263 RepID=UPI0022ABD3EE|nr:hypothetical protein [Flavobacterium eburneipallidum]